MHRVSLLVSIAWLLPISAACAQPVSVPPGREAELEVATWNVEWLGSTEFGPVDEELQLRNVARAIAGAAFDLWALQEIDHPETFEALVARLGPEYDGVLGTSSTNLRFGFVYRRAAIRPIRASDAWLLANRRAFAGRPPLLAEFEVILPDTTFVLTAVTLHMKCCADGVEMRRAASTFLKQRLDLDFADRPVLVVGDFNDELGADDSQIPDRAIGESPYGNFTADSERYRFVTAGIDARDEPTWCANAACTSGSTLDHILVTDELFGALGDETGDEAPAERLDALLADIEQYRTTTSDHLPVAVRLSFDHLGLASNRIRNLDAHLSLYPNPVTGRSTLEYARWRSGRVRIELFDPLGRLVRRIADRYHPPGNHRAQIAAEGLSSGIYLLVVRGSEGVQIKTIAVVR